MKQIIFEKQLTILTIYFEMFLNLIIETVPKSKSDGRVLIVIYNLRNYKFYQLCVF